MLDLPSTRVVKEEELDEAVTAIGSNATGVQGGRSQTGRS